MADDSVRVWVPGCATGEEAYSLAILLREHMDSMPVVPKVQIFATDIDDSAIATARLGRYPETLLDGLSKERLKRFFSLSQGSYCVTKEIRDLCTFSRAQPGSRSAVFGDEPGVLPQSADLYEPGTSGADHSDVSLRADARGILLLGGSESVAQHANLFETLDKKARIFQRREGRSPELKLRWRNPPSVRPRDAVGRPSCAS